MRLSLKAGLAAFLLICATAASAQTDTWPMFRRDAARSAASAGDLVAPPFTQCWRASGQYFASCAVGEGRLFAADRNGNLMALDPATGRVLWSHRVRGVHVATPAVSGSVVFFGVLDWIRGALEARRTETGELLWRFDSTRQVTSSPVVVGDAVIFGGQDRFVYALQPRSGERLWTYETGLSICSSPAVAGGLVFIGSGDGFLYALDLADGALRWRLETGGRVDSSPTVAGGKVFVGSFDGCVYAADAESGRQLWKTPLSDQWVHSSPLYLDGAIYVGSLDGAFYCLDAETGVVRWRQPTGGPIYASPVALGGRVVCGSRDGRLYAFDPKTGDITSRTPLGGYVHSTPATDGLRIYVGSWDGMFALMTDDDAAINAHPEVPIPLSRGRAAAMVLRAFQERLPKPSGPATGTPFADGAADDPHVQAIAGAAQRGIVEGYPSGRFHSSHAATWNEFVVMCERGAQLWRFDTPVRQVDFLPESHWAARAWAAMAGAGVLPDAPDPTGPVTVAEAKAMIEALLAIPAQP